MRKKGRGKRGRDSRFIFAADYIGTETWPRINRAKDEIGTKSKSENRNARGTITGSLVMARYETGEGRKLKESHKGLGAGGRTGWG